MKFLVLGFAREMLGRWGLLLLTAAIFTAAQLSFDAQLGDASLGSYLAYISLWAVVLLFRCGWVLQRRRAAGWPLEEQLRDPHGYRAPLAEFLACALLMAFGFLAALVPLGTLPLELPQDDVALYPVRCQIENDQTWVFELEGRVPSGSELLLTIDWSAGSPAKQELPITNHAGNAHNATAGEIFHWPLSPAELAAGRVSLSPPLGAGLRVFQPLARLQVPRPGVHLLLRLLGAQLLFFLPLLALLLALARFGRIHASLAAWAVFCLGSLVAYRPPPRLADAGLGLLAKTVLLCKQALPAVEGLATSGHRFERLVGTTTLPAIALWLMLGTLALLLACKRRKPR